MSDATDDKMDKPYGSWPSPITAAFITDSGVRLGGLGVNGEDVCWLEGRPKEGGRQVVVRYSPGADGASERNAIDLTPSDVNVRTRVHEYGGGAHLLVPGGGVLYSDFKTQRLYLARGGGDAPLCLTPESAASPAGQYRYADSSLHPNGREAVAVREDHSPSADAAPSEVVNEVVAIALDGSGDTRVLATGRDFYAHPRASPDGATLCYVTWSHPSMPWDATELRIASLSASAPRQTDAHVLVAGSDGDTSILQPAWHPTSGALYYITDESGHYNLARVRSPTAGGAALAPPSPRLPSSADFGGSSPGWALGQQGYTFLGDGRLAAHYTDRSTGRSVLATVVDTDDDAEAAASERRYGQDDGLPPQFGSLAPAADGSLYMMGGSPAAPGGVYRWSGLAGNAAAEMIACSSSARVPPGYTSTPQPVEFPSTLGTSYAYYYPPTNAECTSSEAAPPLLVKAHGGPTAAASTAFSPGVQFFTSRGIAVLDVDYGGSTGYGREYRRRLRGAWGVVDIDDVCAGASHMVTLGLADPARLAIDGGSAGGYTTLGALAFKDVFTAGCSLYGVADLGVLAGDTHKFESRYLDGLVGPYPGAKAVYDERAPINAVDRLSCPILLLQGDEDKIVPPNQATLMHKALLEKGLPCALKMYEGEQHGFRKAENIQDALNSELYFFSRVFGFELEDAEALAFPIDNLDS